MKSSFLVRTKILFLGIVLFTLLLGGKLFLVQVVNKNYYAELADRQYATPSSNIFERGTIYFSTKDNTLVSAATQTSGFKMAIDPSKMADAEGTYNKLSQIIEIDKNDFLARANKKSDTYEEITHHLSKEEADKITALAISGISLFKEKWRFYPGDNMAAHSVGFVGYKGNELGGRYGLERQYETVLARDKNNPYVNFFAEVFSNISDTFFDDQVKGGNLVSTIEPTVQSQFEKTLNTVKAKYSTDSIGGIIMNPTDGSIYAISVKPDFDINNFSKVKSATTFSNPIVENVLEFGSVVKPLVMAAALDAKVVTPSTTYNDKGSVIVEKKEIFNFDKQGRGPGTSMQDVLNQSLNTGMVFVEQKLGKERFRDYLLSFGIKEKTGIDLPNETSGLVSNLQSPRELEYANAAFGQGIALTPIEITRALAALGNGGTLVVPHLVKEIKYDDGTSKKMEYPTTQSKISKATAEEITSMLVTVMDKSIKGGLGKLDHYSVAVKTGTAQVAKDGGGGYYEDRHTHSFFGYFPAYEPKFIVFLYAVNPKGSQYAATTWSDPFLDITKFLLNYYEVPPDR
ncbi:MAG: penicillin-binding protein 2 [Candidatus Pacebacteria bacterium]|nr:penicillin-binding protein 2 [Candidatus Paceibacterota bacterium]